MEAVAGVVHCVPSGKQSAVCTGERSGRDQIQSDSHSLEPSDLDGRRLHRLEAARKGRLSQEQEQGLGLSWA